MEKHIKVPMTREEAKQLKAGDYVYLTGTIYTARDAAHKRMQETLTAGKELPISIEFIQKHPEIDSYFAVEYSLARIVYTCLRKLGLQEKCPVVCFDGSDNIVQESMFTHVKQNEKEIGSLSVRILADEIRGDDEVKTVLVPYHIREMTRGAAD